LAAGERGFQPRVSGFRQRYQVALLYLTLRDVLNRFGSGGDG
jgi:hypothetical protein